ncbi:MAG: copper chaperone PCu(A)C, partial [Microthrixaceae bacterium]|nr:copper chaperone PCu(A)C [Microthrixaceae bacterium]
MTTMKSSRKKFMMTLVAVFAAGALLGSCSSKDDEATETSTTAPSQGVETKDLKLEGAWARPSAKMTSAGAVYMTIINGSDADDELTGVSVEPEVAATAELHETRAVGSGDMGSGDMGSGDMGSGDMGSGDMG